MKEKINDLPPVDIVEILESQDHEQRLTVINQLYAEHASDTLEIGPNMQGDTIPSLQKEKAEDLIDRMIPGQASKISFLLSVRILRHIFSQAFYR